MLEDLAAADQFVAERPADIEVENHGSVVIFQPTSGEAGRWLHTYVSSEGWQWFGGGLAVDPRCVETLIEAARQAGLEVR